MKAVIWFRNQKESSPGNSKKFEVRLWRPRWVCWKLVNGPMSSLDTLVCCDITLSLEPRRESRFSTKYASPPFELPRRRCFGAAVAGVEAFSFSLRYVSSFVKSLVDFLCFNETTLSLQVRSRVEWELCRAWIKERRNKSSYGSNKKKAFHWKSLCGCGKDSFLRKNQGETWKHFLWKLRSFSME